MTGRISVTPPNSALGSFAAQSIVPPLDVSLSLRFTFGVAASMALLDPIMFPPGRERPDRDTLVEGMATYVDAAFRCLHG